MSTHPHSREFRVDGALLEECRCALSGDARIHWLLGGAGSGKSTVARELRSSAGVTVLDMDSRIYGAFHALFSPSRHPVSWEWGAAADGLSWLLDLTWGEFDAFNSASLPEYLDLLARELAALDGTTQLVVDGGVCDPELLSTVIDPSRIVCMRREGVDGSRLWAEPGERAAMRDAVGGAGRALGDARRRDALGCDRGEVGSIPRVRRQHHVDHPREVRAGSDPGLCVGRVRVVVRGRCASEPDARPVGPSGAVADVSERAAFRA